MRLQAGELLSLTRFNSCLHWHPSTAPAKGSTTSPAEPNIESGLSVVHSMDRWHLYPQRIRQGVREQQHCATCTMGSEEVAPKDRPSDWREALLLCQRPGREEEDSRAVLLWTKLVVLIFIQRQPNTSASTATRCARRPDLVCQLAARTRQICFATVVKLRDARCAAKCDNVPVRFYPSTHEHIPASRHTGVCPSAFHRTSYSWLGYETYPILWSAPLPTIARRSMAFL